MDQTYVEVDTIDGQDKRPMAMVTILTSVLPGSVGCAVTHAGHDGTSWVCEKRNYYYFEEKKEIPNAANYWSTTKRTERTHLGWLRSSDQSSRAINSMYTQPSREDNVIIKIMIIDHNHAKSIIVKMMIVITLEDDCTILCALWLLRPPHFLLFVVMEIRMFRST